MTLEEKRERLVRMEWDFFQKVHNEGGRAACQDDPETFFIMRRSQFSPWPEELLDSYRKDLERARAQGRNPLAEKYAWMMERTSPRQFAALRSRLPELADGALEEIRQIVPIQLAWMAEYRQKYPVLASGNRALSSAQDTQTDTSFETYLQGELKTYSLPTLRRYHRFLNQLRREGKNLTLLILSATVRAYGYTGLEEAERRLAQRS